MIEGTKIYLTEQECYGNLIQLYDTAYESLTGESPSYSLVYDPSKVYCTLNVMEVVKKYYRGQKPDISESAFNMGFYAHWANVGPKATDDCIETEDDKDKYILIVQEGWAEEEKEETE